MLILAKVINTFSAYWSKGLLKSVKLSRQEMILISLTLASCIFLGFLLYLNPVHDGDSYEYAGLAKNLVQHHSFREDLLHSYAVQGLELPHPASHRANLYVIFLAPFFKIFGNTHWTFTAASLLGLFILPLVVFYVGRSLVGRSVGFYAALLTLFSPMLLRTYSLADPGLPEVWQMIFFLLFTIALIRNKPVYAGILMAVAFLFKQNSIALILATPIWILFFSGRKLFGKKTIALYTVALLVVLPFLVRSWVLFGSPFYSEYSQSISKAYDGSLNEFIEKGTFISAMLDYDIYKTTDADTEKPPAATIAKNYLVMLKSNVTGVFLGRTFDFFFHMGIFQMMGLILVPFGFLQLFVFKKSPEMSFPIILIVCHVLIVTIIGPYNDRYLLPILPLLFIIGCSGLKKACEAWENRTGIEGAKLAAIVVLFILISDSSGFMAMNLMRLGVKADENIYSELQVTCDYLQDTSSPDTVIMTYPLYSTHYLCNRYTVPMPSSPLTSVAEIIEDYDVEYIVYGALWPGDFFPDMPFADTVTRGKKVSLFHVNREKLESFKKSPEPYFLNNFNPIAYFFSGHAMFEPGPPLYKVLGRYAGNQWVGIFAYAVIACAFVFLSARLTGILKALAITGFVLGIVVAGMVNMHSTFKVFIEANPQLSFIEAKFFAGSLPDNERKKLVIVDSEDQAELKQVELISKDLSALFKNISTAEESRELKNSDSVVFIPVMPQRTWLKDRESFEDNMRAQQDVLQKEENLLKKSWTEGRNSQPIYGGIFIY